MDLGGEEVRNTARNGLIWPEKAGCARDRLEKMDTNPKRNVLWARVQWGEKSKNLEKNL